MKLLLGLFRPIAATLVMAIALINMVPLVSVLGGGDAAMLLFGVPIGIAIYVLATLILWHLSGRPLGPELHLIELLKVKVLKRSTLQS
jgi:hypothetical protein